MTEKGQLSKSRKPIERYLKIHYRVFKTKKVVFGARVLWSHFDGFGLRGCWQTDDQIVEVLCVGRRTVSSWISQLKKADAIIVWAAKSRYRRIWSNQQYAKRLKASRGKQSHYAKFARNSAKSTFNFAKNCSVTPQELRTITTNIIKEDNSTATPSILPNWTSSSAETQQSDPQETVISLEDRRKMLKDIPDSPFKQALQARRR